MKSIIKAIKCGAHLEFDTRWLRHDNINFVVYDGKLYGDLYGAAKILYSGKDIDLAVSVLMSGESGENENER